MHGLMQQLSRFPSACTIKALNWAYWEQDEREEANFLSLCQLYSQVSASQPAAGCMQSRRSSCLAKR